MNQAIIPCPNAGRNSNLAPGLRNPIPMKGKLTSKLASVLFSLWLGGPPILPAAAAPADAPSKQATAQQRTPSDAQLRAAIERGTTYLLQSQNSNGWWSTPEHPAVTALVLTALNGEPSGRFWGHRPSELNRAYDYILNSAKPDGSIERSGLANYNTALCLVALVAAGDTNFTPVILAARRYLAGTQTDFGVKGTNDTPFDGGIGYGSKYLHSDMNNTLTAIEAMRLSEQVARKDTKFTLRTPDADVDWGAVVHFLRNCQNLPSVNKADWVSDHPKDHGGFVYYPGYSMAGGVTNPATGRVSLRSYGTMSYGGLLSYIYARVEKDDPCVTAVLDWLRNNYTIEENPGMNQQGYYYYLHLMTKALTAAGLEKLKVAGKDVDWRSEVSARLLKLQKPDGSWLNPDPRWWEADPVLVTSYAMMTLEILHGYSRP